jgi:adenosine deaminase
LAPWLTKQELIQIERNAFNAAWIPQSERQVYLDRLDAFAQAWGLKS